MTEAANKKDQESPYQLLLTRLNFHQRDIDNLINFKEEYLMYQLQRQKDKISKIQEEKDEKVRIIKDREDQVFFDHPKSSLLVTTVE